MLSFIWENGGDIATKDGDQWVGQLDSPESIAGLEFFKEVFDDGQRGTGRRRRRQRLHRVLQRRGRHDAGAGLEAGPDHQPRRRLPRHGGQHRRVRPARHRRPAPRRPVFLGGSNIGIPANSENQELAYDLLKILVSPGFQKQFAAGGHDPGPQVGARHTSPAATPPSPRRGRPEQPLRADEREVGRRRGGQRPAGHAHRDRPGRRHRRRRRARPTRRSRPCSTARLAHASHVGQHR